MECIHGFLFLSFQTRVRQASERDLRYHGVMRNLVRRYVTLEQRKAESEGVTEDDVNEIKQDISAFRCELIEVLKNSGMNTSTATGVGQGISFGSVRGKLETFLPYSFTFSIPIFF